MLAPTVASLFCNSLPFTTACELCGATAGATASTRNLTCARDCKCHSLSYVSPKRENHHSPYGHHYGHTERFANCSLNLESHLGQPSTEHLNAGGIVECNPFSFCLDPSERHLEVPVDACVLCSCYEGGREGQLGV